MIAAIQRSGAQREQVLLFEQHTSAEHQRFFDTLTGTFDEFSDAVRFIEATYPSSVAEYQRFFAESSQQGGTSEVDPGITLIEVVDPEAVPDLVEREASLGNPDFRVLALGPLLDGQHYVITRTAEDIELSLVPVIGLDVGTLVSEPLTRGDIGRDELVVQSIEDERSLLALFQYGTTDLEDLDLVMILQFLDDPATGDPRALAGQFFDPRAFLEEIPVDETARVNVEVVMLGATQLISTVDSASDTGFDETDGLRTSINDSTNGVDWTLRMWTDGDLGVGTGLFDQRTAWLAGLITTFIVSALAFWRFVQQHRLERATFELEHARTLAATDRLTGLLNREGFMTTINTMDPAAEGTVFFIDLDGFKAVNDTRGHAAGDTVLRKVAKRLRRQFRTNDVVSRFGGDEFVVFTPGWTGAAATEAISRRVVEAIGMVDVEVACSLGTAMLGPLGSETIEEVLTEADAAMYHAKQSGGNAFEAYEVAGTA